MSTGFVACGVSNAHVEGETAGPLPSLRSATSPLVRCNHPELNPLLEYSVLSHSGGGESGYVLALKLKLHAVPIGHTTKVTVEAIWPARSARTPTGKSMEWWGFQVDAEPEVKTPEDSSLSPGWDATETGRQLTECLDNQALVEATYEASVSKDCLHGLWCT